VNEKKSSVLLSISRNRSTVDSLAAHRVAADGQAAARRERTGVRRSRGVVQATLLLRPIRLRKAFHGCRQLQPSIDMLMNGSINSTSVGLDVQAKRLPARA
jgi:hypothetical protein